MRWRTLRKKHPPLNESKHHIQYAGFWSRVLGFTTDIFMLGLPISLLFMILFGHDQMDKAGALDVMLHSDKAITNAPDPMISIAQVLISLIIYVAFWHHSGQTPGKKMARIMVVDAKTLQRASIFQLVLRFLGYFLSALFLFLGFFVGLLRKDKRTLHDLLSRTAVIYDSHSNQH
jgi:uncharacterized RDD family membrane protein YckC